MSLRYLDGVNRMDQLDPLDPFRADPTVSELILGSITVDRCFLHRDCMSSWILMQNKKLLASPQKETFFRACSDEWSSSKLLRPQSGLRCPGSGQGEARQLQQWRQ
jgi:hypothetical protein